MHKLNVSKTNLDCQAASHISKKYCSGRYEDINLFKRQIKQNTAETVFLVYFGGFMLFYFLLLTIARHGNALLFQLQK